MRDEKANMKLTVRYEPLRGRCTVWAPEMLSGEAVTQLLSMVRSLAGAKEVVIDFSGTRLVDSAGIAALVSLTRDIKGKGGMLWLAGLDDSLMALIEETGLSVMLNIMAQGLAEPANLDPFEGAQDIRLAAHVEACQAAHVVHLGGVMGYPAGTTTFKRVMLESMSSANRIVLDCEELTYIDSQCIAAIVQMGKLLRGTGGSLCAAGVNPIIRGVLETLGAARIVELYDHAQQALEALEHRAPGSDPL
ncbi:MAG: STAS domain-containing protein [Chitinivibrionales bacterium]|nr:STAS domain-containing protein [Chitinivibrionales bacterium]MBD3396248.1 STAS domain-containing protein [Chitinivibrionales bacterium]